MELFLALLDLLFWLPIALCLLFFMLTIPLIVLGLVLCGFAKGFLAH